MGQSIPGITGYEDEPWLILRELRPCNFQSGTVHGSLRFSKYLSTKGTPLHAGVDMRFANVCGRILKIPD